MRVDDRYNANNRYKYNNDGNSGDGHTGRYRSNNEGDSDRNDTIYRSSNKGGNDRKDTKYEDDKNNDVDYEWNESPADDLGQWIQDIVQTAVDSMDFSGLNEGILNVLDRARNEMAKQAQKQSESARDNREKKPVSDRQPQGWLRRIPGKWSGPIRTILGGGGIAVFGALSLGVALAAIGFGVFGGIASGTMIALECVFLPLTAVSCILFAGGRNAGKRIGRIQEYARYWGNRSFIMLDELAAKTGYSLKVVRKDIRFIMERHLIASARMDEEKTCLMLTEEAGRQYDAAMMSWRERENANKTTEKNSEKERVLSPEEQKMNDLLKKTGTCIQEIRDRKGRIETQEVREKIDRLELLLARIFARVKDHPENFSQVDRLTEYYLPSVMKLIRVYEDMEKQPIQSDNIKKTRVEIEESLSTVNRALETMYDDLFQDVAMDVSSDIKVLETLLAKDGWSGQELHSSGSEGKMF